MEDYIQEALKQGFIRPSTSPAASSFFFVGKTDRGLRPCIDYQALNSQTVKLPYPLPQVPAQLFLYVLSPKVHRSLSNTEAYQRNHVPAPTPGKVQNPSHFPCLTPENPFHHRTHQTGRTFSPRFLGKGSNLSGP